MSEPTCVWSRGLADAAVRIVLTLGHSLILKGIPGQNFVYMTGLGKERRQFGPSVTKKRILSVFDWIISQTHGFKVPLLVNFRHGEAPTIGLGMSHAFESCHFSHALYALEKEGVNVPQINFGWHSGPGNIMMMISDLSRVRGIMGLSLDGVKVINIHGESERQEQIVLLKMIPS